MRPAWGHSREVQPRGRISSCLEPWQRDSGFMVSPEMVSRPLPHLRPTPMTPCQRFSVVVKYRALSLSP